MGYMEKKLPSIGKPNLNISGSKSGASSQYTEFGPPLIIIPLKKTHKTKQEIYI